jgi:Holliday junction resolvase RusA-like endonuclease
MKYTFTINEKLPSLNDYTKANRSNIYMANEMKRKAQSIIFSYAMNLPEITKPIKLKFTWIEANSRRDLDNICFAKKFILDALVQYGFIIDDNQRYVQGFIDEFQRGKKTCVIVEIEEIENGGKRNDNNISKNLIRNNYNDRNSNNIRNINKCRKGINKKCNYGR